MAPRAGVPALVVPRALGLALLLGAACNAAPLGLSLVDKPPAGGAPLSNDEWSSIVGWISVACWVIVYSPQLLENHLNKSGEGLSILFVYLWLAGDALNMIGAMRLKLLPTMIVLAGYYCLCDVVLIWQYYYYRRYWDYYHPSAPTEGTSLLPSSSGISAHASHASASHISVLPKQPEPRADWRCAALKYAAAFGLVVGAGVAAWAVSEYQGSRHTGHKEPPSQQPGAGEWKWDAQISGWASAALYLSSRIPQLFKNRETHCEGLSFSLFLFAVGGNLTYVLSIVLKSTDRDYLIENASWIVGSLGTVLLDFGVLAQFFLYRGAREADRLAAAEARANGGVAPPPPGSLAAPAHPAGGAAAGAPSAP